MSDNPGIYAIKLFLFDLETTGLDRQNDQICQIAVLPFDKETKPFSIHILPDRNFHPKASEVNGYRISYSSNKRSLTKLGQPVEATTLSQGVEEFYEYLRCQSKSGSEIVLIGYNCKSFDVPFLLRDIKLPVDMREIRFADAYLLMKNIRDTKLIGILNLKQPTVYKYVTGAHSVNQIHDAIQDVMQLKEILKSPKLSITLDDILEYSSGAESTQHTVKVEAQVCITQVPERHVEELMSKKRSNRTGSKKKKSVKRLQ